MEQYCMNPHIRHELVGAVRFHRWQGHRNEHLSMIDPFETRNEWLQYTEYLFRTGVIDVRATYPIHL